MSRPVPILLVLAASLMSACGGDPSGRNLQSITIASTANGNQIQFVATGTFSAPPTTVTPLPVDWSNGYLSPPPPGDVQYTLTTQPYTFNCTASGSPIQVTALAPADTGSSASGSMSFSNLIAGHGAATCP